MKYRVSKIWAACAVVLALGCGSQDKRPDIELNIGSDSTIEVAQLSVDYTVPGPSKSRCVSDSSFVPYKSDEEINNIRKKVIRENYIKIANKQKRKFGLKPYTVPRYHYEPRDSNSMMVDTGVYDNGKIIFFMSNGEINEDYYDTRHLFELYNCYTRTPELIEGETKETIAHELGHAYFFAQVQSQGASSWSMPSPIPDVCYDFINEGVAMYIAQETAECYPNTYTRLLEDYDSARNGIDEYGCGLVLVTPILDADFHDGLEYLIKNPPSVEEIRDMKAYQEKVIAEISP
ncbi:hypothetical protein COV16_02660 [Candidatus Woesearchaeota archaeon CG10_big_fil_rev_8_21_14_0_10_34_8]|nr:MAG: hypothetical protein COV16_02660 [Candidatus Woesearchaeota archaeon CG10_big_fil_rev_8_21_14_0_10_34_8]